jgi:hypothetical protein
VEHAKDLAAQAMEVPTTDLVYEAGQFRVVGTDLEMGLFDLAARQDGGRISVSGDATAGAPSWPNACHVCEVEVDADTGEVAVVAYAGVNDIGRVISPQIVQGQVEGGAVQGIGQALCEQVSYDRETGQLQSASFMDYAVPHADGFLGFKTQFDTSIPCKTNALGVKGVGELGTIGATPAVVNIYTSKESRIPPDHPFLNDPLYKRYLGEQQRSRAMECATLDACRSLSWGSSGCSWPCSWRLWLCCRQRAAAACGAAAPHSPAAAACCGSSAGSHPALPLCCSAACRRQCAQHSAGEHCGQGPGGAGAGSGAEEEEGDGGEEGRDQGACSFRVPNVFLMCCYGKGEEGPRRTRRR